MSRLVANAHAKTNLSLRILGRRSDGFHELTTRMSLISLADTIEFDLLGKGNGVHFQMDGADWKPKTGEENLVTTACQVFAEATHKTLNIAIRLHKKIPSGAGLGGGSSDAAATLTALNTLYNTKLSLGRLLDLAANIGSDVPFFLHGKLCECSGRGECVVPIDDDWELPIVLLKPAFGVATPDAYKRWSRSKELSGVLYVPQLCPWGEMVNDLERPVFQKYPVLATMKMWLLEQPEVHAALLSGSGSTMLAVLSSQFGGENLCTRAKAEFGQTLWTHVGQTLAAPWPASNV